MIAASMNPELHWLSIETAPSGQSVIVFDGLGVDVAHKAVPHTKEAWWDIVGDEDEEFDEDGYAEYLADEADGWVRDDKGSVEYLTPVLWMPLPSADSARAALAALSEQAS